MLIVLQLHLHIAVAALGSPIPRLALDLSGCWMMGASNGKAPAADCGTAPLDRGDGLVYIRQLRGGEVDACLSQACYRPATGLLFRRFSRRPSLLFSRRPFQHSSPRPSRPETKA